MYSHLPNALAELIANSYDADASKVTVHASNYPTSSVVVEDDGHGMSEDDLQDKYLRIGRNRVKAGERLSESGKRRVAGKKGLGKLALFGIGTQVTIRTKRAGTFEHTVVQLDWNEMLAAEGEYIPKSWSIPGSPDQHGTTVTISNLKRKTPIDGLGLANSLSRLFNYIDESFRLFVRTDESNSIEVDRDLRYSGLSIEAEWRVPSSVSKDDLVAKFPTLRGRIISSTKPLSQEMRGVTLYVNGRLANDPEFFGVSESSYAFSYLTGYIDADFLDDLPEDVIATDRRSISWELEGPSELREALGRMLLEVSRLRRETRKQAKKGRIEGSLGLDTSHWTGSIKDRRRSTAVSAVIDAVTSPDSELSESNQDSIIKNLQTIAPEYADFHWRELHSSIQAACEPDYRDGHYLTAIVEGIKRYVNDIRRLSGIAGADRSILEGAFANNPKLDVVSRWLNLNFSDDTVKNIREAQRNLSLGLLTGFRNPISHEEKLLLENEQVFTYQDCLDALSILSHLRRRIDSPET